MAEETCEHLDKPAESFRGLVVARRGGLAWGAACGLMGACLAMGTWGCSLTRQPADGTIRAEFAAAARPLAADAWPARYLPSRVVASGEARGEIEGHEFTMPFRYTGEPVGSSWVVWGGWYEEGATLTSHTIRTCVFHDEPRIAEAKEAPNVDELWGSVQNASPSLKRISLLEDAAPLVVTWQLTLPSTGPINGLCVRLRSIGPQEYEQPIDREMLQRGWAVLTSSGWSLRVPGRGEGSQDPHVPTEPAPKERLLADVSDAIEGLNADWAYATESAIRYAEEQAPRLKGAPRGLVACSFGAIVACSVAARISPDAMVLVGGGADGLRVITYASREIFSGPGILSLGPRGELSPEDSETLVERYLSRSKLDAYHTAPTLAGIPTLMIQGTRDGIVLSRFGDVLWERLGRPERWLGNYGHTLLFYLLPDSAGAIAGWLEEHAAGRAGASGRASREAESAGSARRLEGPFQR